MKGSVPLLIPSTLSGVIFLIRKRRKNLKACLPNGLLSFLNLKADVTNARVFVVVDDGDFGFPSLCFSTNVVLTRDLNGRKGRKSERTGNKAKSEAMVTAAPGKSEDRNQRWLFPSQSS